jgi:hypothetical protein
MPSISGQLPAPACNPTPESSDLRRSSGPRHDSATVSSCLPRACRLATRPPLKPANPYSGSAESGPEAPVAGRATSLWSPAAGGQVFGGTGAFRPRAAWEQPHHIIQIPAIIRSLPNVQFRRIARVVVAGCQQRCVVDLQAETNSRRCDDHAQRAR